jgi:hypothetical protein
MSIRHGPNVYLADEDKDGNPEIRRRSYTPDLHSWEGAK